MSKKKIAFVSQPEYFRFIYENDLDDLFEVREFQFHFGMRSEAFSDLVDFRADFNFFFRGEFFPNDALQQISGVKIALSSEPFPRKIDGKWEYTSDSWKRYFCFRKIREMNFDYIFHYDPASLALFKRDNMSLSGEFVFPVALGAYTSRVTTEKEWDFFFVGRSTGHREDLFMPLKHRFNFLHIAHGISGRPLVEYMHRSRVCLNAHAENEISWEPRMQMMLATGAFVMSEKITPNHFLRPGRDFIEFSSKTDLFEKAQFYLSHPGEREKIVHNAQKSIKEHFDTRKRFQDMVCLMESGKVPRFRRKKKGMWILEEIEFFLKLWNKIAKGR